MKKFLLVTLLIAIGISLLGWATYRVIDRTEITMNAAIERTVPHLAKPKNSTIISLPEFENGLNEGLNRFPILVLEKKNTLVLDDVITLDSTAKVQAELMKMVNKLDKNDPIYLVINSPGGNIDAGTKLIEVLQAQSHPIHTVTLFSASMAFIIVEMLNDRIITPTGTLMSHRASLGGLEGFLDGEFENRLNWIKTRVHYLDNECAKRMNMSLIDYQKMIHNEYWVNGADSIKEKAADKVMLVKCGKSMNGQHTVKLETLFGTIEVDFSNCPLIEAPLAVRFNGIGFGMEDELREFVNTLYSDKFEFFEKYIKTNAYTKYLGN